jgi:hypothetical protein
MEQSDFNHPVWNDLINGTLQVKLNYLAANILLSRLRIRHKLNPSDDEIEASKKEIFSLYLKSKDLPDAKADIQLLLNK